MFESEVSERLSTPGVAIGLAWTAMGGEIMYVEASKVEGEGKLTLTGQLGDVMKESASLALNWVRGHATEVCTSSHYSNYYTTHNEILAQNCRQSFGCFFKFICPITDFFLGHVFIF